MARRVDVVLEDILDAIALIEDAAAEHDGTSFARARFTQRGIERSLEVISEAVRHLPEDLLARRPDIAWPHIRAIGNLMRHEYWRVDPATIWTVVTDDLPSLRAAIEELLRHARSGV